MAFLDWTLLLSPWTAVFLPNVAVFRIRNPIRTYKKIMMVIGIMKNRNDENSNRNGGVGWIVQNADSGMVCNGDEKCWADGKKLNTLIEKARNTRSCDDGIHLYWKKPWLKLTHNWQGCAQRNHPTKTFLLVLSTTPNICWVYKSIEAFVPIVCVLINLATFD